MRALRTRGEDGDDLCDAMVAAFQPQRDRTLRTGHQEKRERDNNECVYVVCARACVCVYVYV